MPRSPLVLAIDVGSSSVRARVFDSRARALPRAGAESRRAPSPDGIEDARALAASVERAVDGALHAAGGASSGIAAVGLATFAGNLLGLDRDGAPTTPLYSYAHAEPFGEVRELRERIDAGAAYQATGCPFHVSYQAPRLLWLKKNRAESFKRTARWSDLGGYLYARWTGRRDVPVSYSIASWSGMLDRNLLSWHQPLLKAIGLDEALLPRATDYDEPLRGLSRRFARRWPALKGVPFYLAIGDGAAANIGSGCGEGGPLALTVGTTAALRAVLPAGLRRVPPGLWIYRVTRGLELLGGALTDGGSLLEWLHKTLRLGGGRLRNSDLARVPPDGHGLTVLPFLRGERSPGWAANASLSFQGLRASTTPAQMARAALEAMSYRLLLISRLIESSGREFKEVTAGGSAILHLPEWMRMTSDILGKPLRPLAERGSTSRGTAILALKAMGALPSLSCLPAKRGRGCEPDPRNRAAYEAGLKRQERLYRLLRASSRS